MTPLTESKVKSPPEPHDRRWRRSLDEAVRGGGHGRASEVVQEGSRLIEEREPRLAALRETLDRAIAEGGEHGDEAAVASLEPEAEALAREAG